MKYIVNTYKRKSKINKEIYGHFSEHLGRCIYGGIYVGEDSPIPNTDGIRNDIIEAFKRIKMPVLRWPGGCFADEYHWKDGIGEKNSRKKMINTHWGGVVEDNSFGTHEFLRLCELVGCEPYICGNVGSGTVQEMQEWIEYITFDGVSPMADLRRKNGREKPWKLKYFGVGNENWGCGGNMRPEFYADQYRRYQTYVRNFSGNRIYKIACGANADDYHWTEVVMRNAHWMMDGISLHYYTIPGTWENKHSAVGFDEGDYYTTLKKALYMDTLIERHSEIMNKYDPKKRIGLVVDEWGTWYDVEPGTNPGFLYQQNTMRDALVAGITLNIFNKHSGRVVMANLAQTVNVLQAIIHTEGEKLFLTPTYHVFDLYKIHQEAELLDSFIDCEIKNDVPVVHESASINSDKSVNVTLCNTSASEAAELDIELLGKEAKAVDAKVLTGAIDAHNTFENPENVKVAGFSDYTIEKGGIKVKLPPCSVASLVIK